MAGLRDSITKMISPYIANRNNKCHRQDLKFDSFYMAVNASQLNGNSIVELNNIIAKEYR